MENLALILTLVLTIVLSVTVLVLSRKITALELENRNLREIMKKAENAKNKENKEKEEMKTSKAITQNLITELTKLENYQILSVTDKKEILSNVKRGYYLAIDNRDDFLQNVAISCLVTAENITAYNFEASSNFWKSSRFEKLHALKEELNKF